MCVCVSYPYGVGVLQGHYPWPGVDGRAAPEPTAPLTSLPQPAAVAHSPVCPRLSWPWIQARHYYTCKV